MKRLGIEMAVILLLAVTGLAQTQAEIDSRISSIQADIDASNSKLSSLQERQSEEASRYAQGLVTNKQYRADLLQFINTGTAERQHLKELYQETESLRRQLTRAPQQQVEQPAPQQQLPTQPTPTQSTPKSQPPAKQQLTWEQQIAAPCPAGMTRITTLALTYCKKN